MSKKLDMPEKIIGERATAIRRRHEFDQDFFDLANLYRGQFKQHLSWIDKANSINDVSNTTEETIRRWDEGHAYAYAILNKEGKTVGAIEAHSIDYENFSAEFAYWLSPSNTGKGYVGETLSNIEKLLFAKGIVRIVIRSNVDNIPSNNVAIRNSYQLEGTLHKVRYRKGKFIDYNLYAKINPEYV